MGEKGVRMTIDKKHALLWALFLGIIFIGGCETVKGAWHGGSDGAKKDWQALLRFDDRMQKNLW